MASMTMKQASKARFFDLCEQHRAAKKNLDTEAGKTAFVGLSVQIHIAKGAVPKRLWPLVNRDD